MLVLDYPRKVRIGADGWGIVIPPFHTGHLGLVPESDAHVSLMRSPMSGPASPTPTGAFSFCELLITPFSRTVGELVRIECSMVDQPGVVESLIDAISGLGVNIVTQESTITEQPPQHQVNMIVDLTPATAGVRESDGGPAVEFAAYSRNAPLADAPLVRLFEAIAERCGNVLTWERDTDGERPRVRIRRVHERRGVELPVRIPVLREKGSSYHVRLSPPPALDKRIRSRLGIASPQVLSYFLVSETEERALHAYVYRNDVRTNLFHLGFYHYDAPGALSAVLKLVARARFNIVTSLLRNQSEREGVWEAVLEYRGDNELPLISATPMERLTWAAETMREKAQREDVENLQNVEAHVGPPRYPKVEDEMRLVRIPLAPGQAVAAGSSPSQKSAQPPTAVDDRWTPARRELTAALVRRRSPLPPVVFISFPKSASRHAAALADSLQKEGYRTDNAMTQEGQDILEDAMAKILKAEFFVGIWHYDDRDSGGATASPWLPFEFGVAMAARKPWLVVRHEHLPQHIWNRIEQARNKPGYSDFTFASETIPMILEHARKHFHRRWGERVR